jgi:hypothetical protein
MVPRDIQGRGVSAAAVKAMGEIALRHGLGSLIAPVRPSGKERYPLVSIERYAQWRRPDGLLFDPWMRVHERLGAVMLKPQPRSLRITGSIAEWEQWTGMLFPESGDDWFPGSLSTLSIDCDEGSGAYCEPNVWMKHALRTVRATASGAPSAWATRAQAQSSSGGGILERPQVDLRGPARNRLCHCLPDGSRMLETVARAG